MNQQNYQGEFKGKLYRMCKFRNNTVTVIVTKLRCLACNFTYEISIQSPTDEEVQNNNGRD